jgi:hypothetical protein
VLSASVLFLRLGIGLSGGLLYCGVSSIPSELLRGWGRVHFYLSLFSISVFLRKGKGTKLFKFITAFNLQRF